MTHCRNADEILDIHEEMVELSHMTNMVSSQTTHVSVDEYTRHEVLDLPIRVCRPENNLSPNASTVSYHINSLKGKAGYAEVEVKLKY